MKSYTCMAPAVAVLHQATERGGSPGHVQSVIGCARHATGDKMGRATSRRSRLLSRAHDFHEGAQRTQVDSCTHAGALPVRIGRREAPSREAINTPWWLRLRQHAAGTQPTARSREPDLTFSMHRACPTGSSPQKECRPHGRVGMDSHPGTHGATSHLQVLTASHQ